MPLFDQLLYDLRYALRSFSRSPGFTATVVLTLALSIGANTALFSALNALVFRQLPVHEPDRLVAISVVDDKGQGQPLIYAGTFEALRGQQRAFASMTLYSGGGLLPTVVRETLVDGLVEGATPEYYALLGVRPFIGRLLSEADAPITGDAAPVIVLGYRYWQRQFGGDPNVINQTVTVSGVPLAVIGVTPPGFHGLQVDGGADFMVPLGMLRRVAGDPRLPIRGWNIIGRLHATASLDQARAEVARLWPSLQAATMPAGLNPAQQDQMRSLRPVVESVAGGFSPLRTRYQSPLSVLVGLAGVLLAIGCANLGGLLLARAVGRDQQVAVQIAIGASRGRLVQQLIVESLVLSMAGTLCAIPLAWWASRLLGTVLRGNAVNPLALSMTPDARVLSLAVVVAVGTGLIVSVLPACLTTGPRASTSLRRSRTSTTSTATRGLVVAQIALSMILIVGAGLFARSLARLRTNDSAFPTDRVAFARLWLKPGVRTTTIDAAYLEDLAARISSVPGFESLGFSMVFPSSFNFRPRLESIAPTDAQAPSDGVNAIVEMISPRFFETVGIPRRQGRDFEWHDDGRRPAVAIVNASLANGLFGAASAVGRTIRVGSAANQRAIEIVGIVADAPVGNLRDPHTPVVFRPMLQDPQRSLVPIVSVRTRSDVAATAKALQDLVPAAGPHYVRRVDSLEAQVTQSLLQERLLAWLAVLFAGLATLVSCIGIYGLLAYAVARRTRELGVRMALGASRGSVLRLVMNEGLALALLGIAIGIPCGAAVGRLSRSLLYDLTPGDPLTLVGAALLFVLVAVAAGWRPAWRAASIDPMTALRQD